MHRDAAHLIPWEPSDATRADEEVGEDCEAVFDIECHAIATTTRDGRRLCDDCAAAWDEAEEDGEEPDDDEDWL